MTTLRTALVLALAALAPAGCGTAEILGAYDLPESEAVAASAYPRLADVPPAPPAGQHSDATPDPARGVATLSTLGERARAATARAKALEGGVLTPAERAALEAAGGR